MNNMYTIDFAQKMRCILSKSMHEELRKIYDQSEILSVLSLRDNKYCIADTCEYWKWNQEKTHGYCSVLGENKNVG